MSTVDDIEKAIERLPPGDLAELRRWFAQFDSARWDSRLEADASSGKLDALAEEALAEYRGGKVREI
ncbi:MAG: hypothetical protein K0U79_05495 [Gammaproteobacteria bacterium]|nr:hypothetical protein [Gammaproteobacteria bacterium]